MHFQEINERIVWLVDTHSDLLSTQYLATTHEGRDIEAVVVREPGPPTKPVIWIDCGIHAREWVSPPTCLHAIQRLVEAANSVEPRENLLAAFDFYILPVANPDGYEYSWTTNRMWRKNRRPHTSGQSPFGRKCFGVDPNRNFPVDFYGSGASMNPCDDVFHGNQPFSEPESQAIRDAVNIINTKVSDSDVIYFEVQI